jgi:hypothetical protein
MKTLGRPIREKESLLAWVVATEEEAKLNYFESKA